MPGDEREAVASGRADFQREALLGRDIHLVGSLDREGADAYSSFPQRAESW